MDTWGACTRVFQKTVVEVADFFHVVEVFFLKGTSEEISLFVRTVRKLWFRRNDWIFNE
jgi:hypothetical protein